MKGFPNQVPDLLKLASGLAVIERLNAEHKNTKSYDVLGEALVRDGVLGTGHTPKPVNDYIAEQRAKNADRQSHQTGARGLREQYRLLRLIDDSRTTVELTEAGRRIAAFAGRGVLDDEQREQWRRLIVNISQPGRDGAISHPYQVMLRLVARKPGIPRAKCALALEARDDSDGELDRIVALSDLTEGQIRTSIGETKSNWDNAKKIFPRFAEQLGDVTKVGRNFYLARAPGEGGEEEPGGDRTGRGIGGGGRGTGVAPVGPAEGRGPRASRRVTPDTIGRAGTEQDFDEVDLPVGDTDPAAMAAAIAARRARLRRHNLIVQEIARHYDDECIELFEGRYDCLASLNTVGILHEVKTLDGSRSDEESQVRDALGQLLYYEPFVRKEMDEGLIHKVAVFESPVSDEHIQLLSDLGIVTIWKHEGRFVGGPGAPDVLGPYFEELR